MNDVILQEYQVRKSNKEKTKFIEYLTERLSVAGYDKEKNFTIEKKGKGILMSRNIVVGNPDTADVLLTAHYDTCAMLPFPNLMSPTNPLLFWGFQILLTAFLFVIAFLIAVVVILVTDNALSGAVAIYFSLIFMMGYILFGYRNKHTANDNTSGVITITKILEALPNELREKVCVVYFDNEEKGLLGSDFFKSKHKKEVKDKLLFNFDCVGDGRHICFLGKRKARKDEKYQQFLAVLEACAAEHDVEFMHRKMKFMMFSSDQMYFDKGVGICALQKSPIGMYVARIHTPFDTKCRAENIEFLVSGVISAIANI